MKYIIRDYKNQDLHSVAVLISNTFRACNFSDNDASSANAYIDFFDPEKTDAGKIREVFQNASVFLVAVAEEKIVGAIRGNPERISSLFVSPEYQSHGIGKALVHEFEKRSNSETISVNSQLASVGFYTALGFKQKGEEIISQGLRVLPMLKQFGKDS